MNHCAYCTNPATTRYTAHGTNPTRYRAIQTCPHHRTKAHTWASRAGPPHETTITNPEGPLQLF